MREILFRGKSILTRKFVYGDLFHDCDLFGHITASYIYEFDLMHGRSFQYEVDFATIGQFTGQVDKGSNPQNDRNIGRKIYEGDIVKAINTENIGEIKYLPEHASFVVRCTDEKGQYYEHLDMGICATIFEVIGNIHENPKLLEVPK